MNETELERMVVRLTGDGSEYVRMLQQAQQETRDTAMLVEEQGKRIEGFGDKLKGFAAGAIAYLGSLGIKQWLMETLSAYNEQEKAERQLGAILQVNGREVEQMMDRYKNYANEMQRVTGQADELTLSMLQQAEAMGVTGANAERAVRNVIAAQAAGMHIGIRQAVGLEQGHLGRLALQLGDLGSGSEEEKIAKAQEKLTKMFAIAELEGTKATVQLRVAWNELYEDFGKAFKQVMKPINEVKLAVVNWFRSLSDGTKQAIVVLASVATAVLAVAAAIATAGFIFNTMFGGIGLIVGVIVTAGTASAYWLSTFESIGKAWEYVKEVGGAAWTYIKDKAIEFWDYIRPVALQTWNILVAGWDLVKEAASIVWEYIKDISSQVWSVISGLWRSFFGDWRVDWTNARMVILTVLIDMEFALRNLSAVGRLAIDSLRLTFHVWFEEVKHGLSQMFSTETTARVIGQFERDLRTSVNRQIAAIAQGRDELRALRFSQLLTTPQEEAAAQRAGQKEEAARNVGKKKEMEKFEAAARYSAEAVSRIYAYMERVKDERRATGQAVAPREVVVLGGAEANQRIEQNRQQLVVLNRIANGIDQLNNEPQIVLEPVGLG